MESRHVTNCWTGIFRTKSANVSLASDSMRVSGFFDLVKLGLGSSLALSLLVVCIQIMADVSGPSVIISVLLAALAAFTSSVCFAELRCRWVRVVGNAYDYTYVTVGEGAAFLCGWTLLLHYIACSSTLARAISANFDALLGFRIHNLTSDQLGKIDKLNSYPDFIAGFVLILIIAVVAVGVRQPHQVTSFMSAALLLVVTFALVVSLFHLKFSLWSTSSKFFPRGLSGVLEGAGGIFVMFSSFDLVLSRSDLIGRPGHRAMYAVVTSLTVITFFTVAVTSTSSLLHEYDVLQTEAGFVEAFDQARVTWVKYIVSPCALVVLASSLLMLLTDTAEFVLRLSKDGMLFGFLSWTSKDDDMPMFTVVFPGVISVVFSVIFSLTDLIIMASMSSLFVYSCTTVVLMSVRYTPPSLLTRAAREERKRKRDERRQQNKMIRTGSSGYGTTNSDSSLMTPSSPTHLLISSSPLTPQYNLSDGGGEIEQALGLAINENGSDTPVVLNSDSESDIDEVVEDYKEKLRNRALTTCSLGNSRQEIPTESTHRRACLATISFCLWLSCLSAILHRASDELKDGSVVLIICVIIFLVLMIASVIVLARQPCDVIETCDVAIRIPQFPWMTLITLVIDLHLMVSLPSRSWLMFFLWIVAGVILYVCYGVRHSKAANLYNLLPEEHQGLISSPSARGQHQQIIHNHGSPSLANSEIMLQEDHENSEDDTPLIE